MARLQRNCMTIPIKHSVRMCNRIDFIIKILSVFSARIFQILLKHMGFAYAYVLKICIQMDTYIEWNLHLKHIPRILKYFKGVF